MGSRARQKALDGLTASPKWLSPTWLYDDVGSALFERITSLPEYYPTRRERLILRRHAADIAGLSGADTLVEIGSGVSDKTRLLLDALAATGHLARFVPFDIALPALTGAARSVASAYAGVEVHVVAGDEAVVHVSWFQADAFARWAWARLPRESEWEALAPEPDEPAAIENGFYRTVWQWTASPYAAYPGFAPPAGAIGEYNGKFMVNQQVLRGSCRATPPVHARRTYRNFFRPHARWMFAWVRLARDAT